MMKPEISIIIPVYNAENTLSRCLDSVLSQSFQNYEMILVNDGSLDGSGQLCDQYALSDKRIRIIHKENGGVSSARNVGIAHASGIYLLFLDSDDALEPDALRCYSEASEDGVRDVVIGSLAIFEGSVRTRKIGRDQQIRAGSEIWEQICTCPELFGYAGGKMIRAELIHNNHITFNTHMHSQEDMDFFLSAYKYCTQFSVIPQTVYQYYYVPTVRKPPIWDFIANQIKMLHIGNTQTELSAEASACVHKRILSLLYTGLYEAASREDYNDVVEKLSRVDGLTQLLRTLSAEGEHGFIARNFAAGNYGRIRRYFRLRNGIRDVVRMLRKRKPE